MYNIIKIEQINDHIYKIKLLEKKSNDILIMNMFNTTKLKNIFFNSNTNEITNEDNKNKIKINQSIVDNYSLKDIIKQTIASGFLAMSLYMPPNADINKENIFIVNNLGMSIPNNIRDDEELEEVIDANINEGKGIFLVEKNNNDRNHSTTEYKELLETLQTLVINNFYENNEKELKAKNITKDKIKNEMILQIDKNNNYENNFALSFMGYENKINNNNLNQVKSSIKNVLDTRIDKENITIGNMNVDKIINNKGMISLSFPENLIDKVLENMDNQDYLQSFLAYTYNFSNHELSHLYFQTNEFKAVEQQKEDITNKEFKNDLIKLTPQAKSNYNDLEATIENLLEKQDLKDIQKIYKTNNTNEIQESYNNIKSLLLNKKNINEYLNNDISNENILLYSASNRDVLKNSKFINNNEYLSAIIKEDKLIFDTLSNKEKEKVDFNKYLGKQVEFTGGGIYNLMLILEEKNASNVEKDLFKKLCAKDFVEALTGEQFNINNKEHSIFFEKYSNQLNKLEDLAISNSIKLDKNEYSFNER